MADELNKDYTLEKSDKEPETDDSGIPVYMETLKLNEEQKKRLSKEFFEELDVIKQERTDKQLEQKWKALDCQYEGDIEDDDRLQFNLNRNITKPIVDRVVNYVKQAFLKSDPKFSVSPRPEYEKEGKAEICDKQQDFLDYKLDNLPSFREAMGKVAHSAVNLGDGILKIFHEIKREKRRREERYQGNPTMVIDPSTGQPRVDPNTGMPIIQNKGLEEFLRNWPDAETRYPGMAAKLAKGEEINIVAEYTETTYNDPMFKAIPLKDFYVRTTVQGLDGLKTTQMVAERQEYTYWELKKEEKRKKFFDIDELVYEDKDKTKKKEHYQNETYVIYEVTYYFKLKDSDDEEVKIVFWIAEEKKIIIGVVYYPYYGFDVGYLPFYISEKGEGFYHKGLAEYVTDNNQAQSIMLNLALGAMYINNTITPIVPANSDAETQFLEKQWTHGIPINAKVGEIDFLQKYMQRPDVNGIVGLLQLMKQDVEEQVGSSSLMSGKETPTDPTAPAAKTIALLQQAGIPVEEYIANFTPSFNEIAYVLLQLYHQMSREGRKYAIRSDRVVGEDIFGEIDRSELVARTTIQAQAYTYDFDKLNAKKEDFALYQILRQELLVIKNPESVYFLLKNIVKNWGPKWRAHVDKILPPLAQFKQMQLNTAVQAVAMYVEAKLKASMTTGVPPEFDLQTLMPLITDAQAEMVTPPPKEIMDERAKQQEGV